jgi:excisionase family DNA binding protein
MAGTRTNKLSKTEITQAFTDEQGQQTLPPILSPDGLADLLDLSVKTIYEWIAKGRLDGTFRKRGKHVLIWRDRAVDLLFNGPDWRTYD